MSNDCILCPVKDSLLRETLQRCRALEEDHRALKAEITALQNETTALKSQGTASATLSGGHEEASARDCEKKLRDLEKQLPVVRRGPEKGAGNDLHTRLEEGSAMGHRHRLVGPMIGSSNEEDVEAINRTANEDNSSVDDSDSASDASSYNDDECAIATTTSDLSNRQKVEYVLWVNGITTTPGLSTIEMRDILHAHDLSIELESVSEAARRARRLGRIVRAGYAGAQLLYYLNPKMHLKSPSNDATPYSPPSL
ncbi:hypothetical protein HK097_010476 [Rhizophlyctis rosea]|uniref:Uncharacterized protein n=1 Tax=Rhizophlyctis rosea TaxID=64517 RepID=A0AAD5SI45_9FUNG|nr:hypothetical protein HK097_010476 [Rhizophlyctis rosea]